MPEEDQNLAHNPPPLPTCNSTRLVGLELEFDAGRNSVFHPPILPSGWQEKADGSLANGKEYILGNPIPANAVLPFIVAFSDAAAAAKMHVCRTGGFHIHVQAHDYTDEYTERLALLYYRFQHQIDELCGASRRRNDYCMPFSSTPNIDYLRRTFRLNVSAANRVEAKGSREKFALNFAMLRCTNAGARSIEFRQPSPSKRVINIYGWACLAVGLVEFAMLPWSNRFTTVLPRWQNFESLCSKIEAHVGMTGLVDWVRWRRAYLRGTPTDEQMAKMYRLLAVRSHGLLFISQRLGINMAMAQRAVDIGLHAGRLSRDADAPGKYRVTSYAVAEANFDTLMQHWSDDAALRPEDAVVSAVPACS